MAGTTTPVRAGWGIIASSYAQNPVAGNGYLKNNNVSSGNFGIYNIDATQWKDLEMWIHWQNQSTWSGQGYWNFNPSSANQGCYNYWGWSTGQSQGGSSGSDQYVYPVAYSNMWSAMHLYCANAFTNQNTKAWWYEAGNSTGSSNSYATVQSGAGVYRSSSPITQMSFSTPWGNGSSSYQGWVIIGRNPK